MSRISLSSFLLLLLLTGSAYAQPATVWLGGDDFGEWFEPKNWSNDLPSASVVAKIRDGSAKLSAPNGISIAGLEIAAGSEAREATLLVVDSDVVLFSDLLVGRTTIGEVNGLLQIDGEKSLIGGDISIGSSLSTGHATGIALISGAIIRSSNLNIAPSLVVGENRGTGSGKGQLVVSRAIGEPQFGYGSVAVGRTVGQTGFADGTLETGLLFGSPESILLVGVNESTSGDGKAIGELSAFEVDGFALAEFGVNQSPGGTADASISIGGAYNVAKTSLGSPDGSGIANMIMQPGSKFVGTELIVNQGSEFTMWNSVDATYLNQGIGSIQGTPGPNFSGRVNITGAFLQSPTGVLQFDINGDEQNTGYENILVRNDVSMSGRVHLNFAENFSPKIDQIFNVISVGQSYNSSGLSVTATNLPPEIAINVIEDNGLQIQLVKPQPISYLFNNGFLPIWHDEKNWNAGQIPTSINALSLINENRTDRSLVISRPATINDLQVGGVSSKMRLIIPAESKLSVTHDLELLRNGEISSSSEIVAKNTMIKPGGSLLAQGKITGAVESRGLVRIGTEQNTSTKLSIDGDFQQLSQGVIEMDILGSELGEFDQLFVDGDVALNGTISFSLPNPKAITPGQAMPILTATGKIQGDLRIEFPLLDNNLEFGLIRNDERLPGDDEYLLISGETGPGDVGDMNRDGRVDECDFEAFSLGILDVMSYMDIYIFDPSSRGNINDDGSFDVDDIQPFFDLINGVPCAPKAVPEPTSLMMLGTALLTAAFVRRKRSE